MQQPSTDWEWDEGLDAVSAAAAHAAADIEVDDEYGVGLLPPSAAAQRAQRFTARSAEHMAPRTPNRTAASASASASAAASVAAPATAAGASAVVAGVKGAAAEEEEEEAKRSSQEVEDILYVTRIRFFCCITLEVSLFIVCFLLIFVFAGNRRRTHLRRGPPTAFGPPPNAPKPLPLPPTRCNRSRCRLSLTLCSSSLPRGTSSSRRSLAHHPAPLRSPPPPPSSHLLLLRR
jgi:hypothetical protein